MPRADGQPQSKELKGEKRDLKEATESLKTGSISLRRSATDASPGQTVVTRVVVDDGRSTVQPFLVV